jgi:hypothetical protein
MVYLHLQWNAVLTQVMLCLAEAVIQNSIFSAWTLLNLYWKGKTNIFQVELVEIWNILFQLFIYDRIRIYKMCEEKIRKSKCTTDNDMFYWIDHCEDAWHCDGLQVVANLYW